MKKLLITPFRRAIALAIAAVVVVGCRNSAPPPLSERSVHRSPVSTSAEDPSDQQDGEPGADVGVASCGQGESSQCTPYLMFYGPLGELYVGATSSCVLTSAGEVAWTSGSGPLAVDETGEQLGQFIYAVSDSARDFALIQLDPDVTAEYAKCSGSGSGSAQSSVVLYYDRGTAVGPVVGLFSDDSRILAVSVTEGDGQGPIPVDIAVDTLDVDVPQVGIVKAPHVVP